MPPKNISRGTPGERVATIPPKNISLGTPGVGERFNFRGIHSSRGTSGVGIWDRRSMRREDLVSEKREIQ